MKRKPSRPVITVQERFTSCVDPPPPLLDEMQSASLSFGEFAALVLLVAAREIINYCLAARLLGYGSIEFRLLPSTRNKMRRRFDHFAVREGAPRNSSTTHFEHHNEQDHNPAQHNDGA